MNFEQFDLDSRLMQGIKKAGYETATPIQEAAIPAALRGRDLIGTAHDRYRQDRRVRPANLK